MLGQESVEDEDEQDDCDGEQCAMPLLVNIAVVVEDNEALYLSGSQEATNRTSALPSNSAQPANEVRQHFLRRSRGELRYPMVLST